MCHCGKSRVFRHVLHLLVHLAAKFITSPPSDRVNGHILSNPKFSPFFNNCLGAIDGVHIPASVPTHQAAAYWNCKGFLSQNVLGVCDFNMKITYVHVGWEGTAHDSRVLNDARSLDFMIPSRKFQVTDAGYGLDWGVLVPYQGTRYHLKEQAAAGQQYFSVVITMRRKFGD